MTIRSNSDNKNSKSIGEFELIEEYFAPLATDQGARALIDDAASIEVPAGKEIVVTTDMLVAGVHFRKDDPADLIARKALRVNLSDLAGKGAEPCAYQLALSLPQDWTPAWIEQFCAGLAKDQDEFGISLFGGDTTRTIGPMTIAITAMGLVPAGSFVTRDGAQDGDLVYVSGSIGDAALGLTATSGSENDEYLRGRYLVPQPKTKLTAALVDYANAAMDISDGLIGDLEKMCRASGLGATLEQNNIPLSQAARAKLETDQENWTVILTGGDDYEILAAIAPENAQKFEAAGVKTGINLTKVGVFDRSGTGVQLTKDGNPVALPKSTSFTHF